MAIKHLALALAIVLAPAVARADPMSCSLDGYRAQPGLAASQANDVLTIQWAGDRNQELRLRFALVSGTPTIQELAIRKARGTWGVVAANVVPDYRVMSGLRRMSNQQMQPLRGLGVELTGDDRRQVPLGSFLGCAARSQPPSRPRRQSAAGRWRRQSARTSSQDRRDQARVGGLRVTSCS